MKWVSTKETIGEQTMSKPEDISLADLYRSEQMLKESLFTVGYIAGLNDEQLETDWQRIKL